VALWIIEAILRSPSKYFSWFAGFSIYPDILYITYMLIIGSFLAFVLTSFDSYCYLFFKPLYFGSDLIKLNNEALPKTDKDLSNVFPVCY
jgi:hypothetical protein